MALGADKHAAGRRAEGQRAGCCASGTARAQGGSGAPVAARSVSGPSARSAAPGGRDASVAGAAPSPEGPGKDASPTTEDLLERLLSASDPAAYLDSAPLESRELSEYLADLLAEHGVKRSEAIRRSSVNATFAYQIFQGTRRPGRDTAIQLAFGIGADLPEAQRALRLAGHGPLWPRDRRDAIVISCIARGFTLAQCDDELFRLGEAPLGRD